MIKADQSKSPVVFTEEELENIRGLCEVLQAIRTRLLKEGMSPEELQKTIDSNFEKCYSGRPC